METTSQSKLAGRDEKCRLQLTTALFYWSTLTALFMIKTTFCANKCSQSNNKEIFFSKSFLFGYIFYHTGHEKCCRRRPLHFSRSMSTINTVNVHFYCGFHHAQLAAGFVIWFFILAAQCLAECFMQQHYIKMDPRNHNVPETIAHEAATLTQKQNIFLYKNSISEFTSI